jgi:hypothetical protein
MSGHLEALGRYLEARDADRRTAVHAVLQGLTEREARLVREAAVMGYVRGVQCGPHRDQIPHDAEILWEVIDACLAMPDLYPVISEVGL